MVCVGNPVLIMTWRIKMDDRDPERVDEVVMQNAYVHLEDMGNAYSLILENTVQHIHLTIPHRELAWIFEQFVPEEAKA